MVPHICASIRLTGFLCDTLGFEPRRISAKVDMMQLPQEPLSLWAPDPFYSDIEGGAKKDKSTGGVVASKTRQLHLDIWK